MEFYVFYDIILVKCSFRICYEGLFIYKAQCIGPLSKNRFKHRHIINLHSFWWLFLRGMVSIMGTDLMTKADEQHQYINSPFLLIFLSCLGLLFLYILNWSCLSCVFKWSLDLHMFNVFNIEFPKEVIITIWKRWPRFSDRNT